MVSFIPFLWMPTWEKMRNFYIFLFFLLLQSHLLPFLTFLPFFPSFLLPSPITHTNTYYDIMSGALLTLRPQKREREDYSRNSSILTSEYSTSVKQVWMGERQWPSSSWPHVSLLHKTLRTGAYGWWTLQVWAGVGLTNGWVVHSKF